MAADLQFKIGADLAEIKGALAGLRKDFAATGQAANAAGNTKGIDAIAAQARSAAFAVKALAAGFAGLQLVRTFSEAARAGVAFNAELEAANSAIASLIFAQAKLKDAQGQVVDGAKGLQVAYALAAEQVQKLRIAGLETAATSTQLVEAFQTAVGPGIAAGLNLDEIRTLTIQITQAAGALNVPFDQLSQEIRSILDGSIDVNSRVAKTLGISNEQVKNWQAQNKLVEELSKRLAPFEEAGRAAADNFKVIASNAQEAVDTLRGEVFKGFTDQLKNGLKDATAGIFDTKTLGVTEGLRDAVVLAQELATVVGAALADSLRGVVGLARDFSAYVRENRGDIDILLDLVKFVAIEFGKLVRSAASLAVGVADAGLKLNLFQATLLGIGFLLAGIRDGFRTIAGVIVGIGSLILTAILAPFEGLLRLAASAASALGKDGLAASLLEAANALDDVASSGRQAAQDILQPIVDGKGAVADAVRDLNRIGKEAAKAGSQVQKAAQQGAGGSVAGLRNPPKLPGADGNALLKDRLERELRILEDNYKDGLVSLSDYYRERQRLQEASIDAEIAAERVKQSRLQKADENGQRDAATKIALLEAKKADVQRDAGRGRYMAEKELQDQIAELQAQALENTGQLEGAAVSRAQLKFRDLLQRLRTEGKTEIVALIETLIDTDRSRARFDEIKRQADSLIADLERRREQIARLVDTGAITPAEGRTRDQGAQADAAARLVPVNEQLQQLAATLKDPALVESANALSDAIAKIGQGPVTGLQAAIVGLRKSLDDMNQAFAQSAVNAGVDAATQLFTDLASGSKSAGEALRDFVRNFAASMASIAARALATTIILKALEAYSGVPASVLAGGVGAAPYHSGGMVSASAGAKKQYSPWVFAGAPRLHNGSGVLGLKSDEIPAILQTGERVQSRAEVAAMQGGGGGTRIINVIDPNLVQDYLASAAGERTIVNVLQRNAGAVKQALA